MKEMENRTRRRKTKPFELERLEKAVRKLKNMGFLVEEKEEEKSDEEKKDGDAGDREKKKSGDGLLSKVRWSFAKMFNDMNNETV